MNWRCRLGLHCWEEVDTSQEWERFCRKKGYKKKCIPIRNHYAVGPHLVTDEFCLRCGKRSLEFLERNKDMLPIRETKYVLKNGKITKEKRPVLGDC